MPDWMFLIIATLVALIGMGCLALSLNSHWLQAFPEQSEQSPTVPLRMVSVACFLLTAFCCFMADRPSIAVLVWIMLMALSAVTVAMILSRVSNK